MAHRPQGPRKLVRGTTQVSLPREFVRELGADPKDPAGFAEIFGDPPQVLFQLYGSPPVAVLVWPLNNEDKARALYEQERLSESISKPTRKSRKAGSRDTIGDT